VHGAFEDGTAWQHVVSIPCDQLTNDDAALDRAFDKVPVGECEQAVFAALAARSGSTSRRPCSRGVTVIAHGDPHLHR
jgi:hypothetical protein